MNPNLDAKLTSLTHILDARVEPSLADIVRGAIEEIKALRIENARLAATQVDAPSIYVGPRMYQQEKYGK